MEQASGLLGGKDGTAACRACCFTVTKSHLGFWQRQTKTNQKHKGQSTIIKVNIKQKLEVKQK
jgi:hypothetical protein